MRVCGTDAAIRESCPQKFCGKNHSICEIMTLIFTCLFALSLGFLLLLLLLLFLRLPTQKHVIKEERPIFGDEFKEFGGVLPRIN